MKHPTPSPAKRARYKLFGSILTTYGYAVLGVAIIQPLMAEHAQELTTPRRWGILLAVVLQGAAVYIAPKGEPA